MKKKLLAWGDSPTSTTGMGKVNKEVMAMLHSTGEYDITFVGIHYLGEMYDRTVIPYNVLVADTDRKDMLGRNTFLSMLQWQKWDVVYTHQDLLNINSIVEYILKIKEISDFKWVVYSPIDTDQLQKEDLLCIEHCDTFCTYSEFGKESVAEVNKELGEKTIPMLLGVNLDLFYKMDKKSKAASRKKVFGIEDDSTFIVTNVNANRARKDLPRTILAFKMFSDLYPKSMLYIHARKVDFGGDLEFIANRTGLGLDKIIFNPSLNPVQGIDENKMVDIYGSSDVIVSTSMAEGFGLSCLEAFATGVPAVFPKHTSLVELIGKSSQRGFFIDLHPNKVFSREYGTYWLPMCDEASLARKLEYIYLNRNIALARADEALEWVKDHSWEKRKDKWISIFKELTK